MSFVLHFYCHLILNFAGLSVKSQNIFVDLKHIFGKFDTSTSLDGICARSSDTCQKIVFLI